MISPHDSHSDWRDSQRTAVKVDGFPGGDPIACAVRFHVRLDSKPWSQKLKETMTSYVSDVFLERTNLRKPWENLWETRWKVAVLSKTHGKTHWKVAFLRFLS